MTRSNETSPKPQSRVSKIIASAGEQQRHQLRKQILSIGKYMITLLVPLTGLLLISSIYLLTEENAKIKEHLNIKQSLDRAESVYRLITRLQVERGLTCVALTARVTRPKATGPIENVLKARGATDKVLQSMREENVVETKDFTSALTAFRIKILQNGTECAENLQWYTSEINQFILSMQIQLKATEDGKFWNRIAGHQAFIVASDLIGLMRARGASAFVDGRFSTQEKYTEFSGLTGGATVLLGFAEQFSETFSFGNEVFGESHKIRTGLVTKLKEMEDQLLTSIHTLHLENLTDSRLDMGNFWFQNVTEYMILLSSMESETSKDIRKILNDKIHNRQTFFYFFFGLVLLLGGVCCVLLAYCWKKVQRLLEHIKIIMAELHEKTEALGSERERMNALLHEMVPAHIAHALKNDQPVEPAVYDEVTVFYSSIKGFDALVSKSKPMEVVDLLNHLYTFCDDILDRYSECYKVETIGDSYMIVSGCPILNGERHSAEVATFSLNVQQMIEDFVLPHRPDHQLFMRIGIHTGSCAAGVVGRKMPRYCVFGDTVAVASRMEHTGKEKQIQLSHAAYSHLTKHHPGIFETETRGYVAVKGKRSMITHWLIGKKDFPYRIELPAADDVETESAVGFVQ